MDTINPKNIISPCFHKIFDDIFLGKHIHYWLKGGRGSTKSSFISIMIVLTIFESYLKFNAGEISQAELANAICFRKIGNSLRNSIGSQIKWAIDQLHMNSLFTEKTAVNQFVFNPTGQLIFLAGCDDPQKIKSIKPRVGFFKCVWFEELAEFSGMFEIRTLLQSVIRGGENFRIFYSYNPPQVRQNWVNFESEIYIPSRLVHHSTYLDVPKEWLGKQFIAEAELLKKTKPQNYEHEYLGIATGTGGSVFENLELREITDEEIQKFDRIRQGIDWGFSVDPACFIRCHFDKTRRVLYLIDEIYQTHLFNSELMDLIKQKGYNHTTIIADSAEPKSISEFWYNGFMCYGAKKKQQGKKGYVSYGVKFLQDLQKIVIDQRRTPNAHREFALYEYEKDKNGEFKPDYPDKNNHCLIADTLITTDKGLKPIQFISTADMVLTRAGFRKVLWAGITKRNVEVATVRTKYGRYLTGTYDHPVFSIDRFIDITNLKPDDELFAVQDSNFVCDYVKDVTCIGIADCVYDITVDGQHEFFANEILVHNSIDAVRYALEEDMEVRGIF